MNDIITAATSGLFVEVGKVIEHMKAQQTRIADLERQLAEASAPAVDQQPVAQVAENHVFLLRKQPNGDRWPVGTKLYAAPQAADTDKVREAILKLNPHEKTMLGHAHGAGAYCEGFDHGIAAAAELVGSMAAQAPVREVPEGIEDPITVPRGLVGAACYLIRKYEPDSKLLGKLRAFTIGRTEEAAPVLQEGGRG